MGTENRRRAGRRAGARGTGVRRIDGQLLLLSDGQRRAHRLAMAHWCRRRRHTGGRCVDGLLRVARQRAARAQPEERRTALDAGAAGTTGIGTAGRRRHGRRLGPRADDSHVQHARRVARDRHRGRRRRDRAATGVGAAGDRPARDSGGDAQHRTGRQRRVQRPQHRTATDADRTAPQPDYACADAVDAPVATGTGARRRAAEPTYSATYAPSAVMPRY